MSLKFQRAVGFGDQPDFLVLVVNDIAAEYPAAGPQGILIGFDVFRAQVAIIALEMPVDQCGWVDAVVVHQL